jgi:hypothetical protein
MSCTHDGRFWKRPIAIFYPFTKKHPGNWGYPNRATELVGTAMTSVYQQAPAGNRFNVPTEYKSFSS